MGIRIIKNNKLWMEDEAIHQLERIALFKNVVDVVGLPDLHPAKTPVGTTVKTQKLIYPILIGNDIGCGVSLYDIDMKIKKVNLEKVLKKLSKTSIIGEYSIGGGNHFIEMTQLDKIYDHKYIDILNLNQRHLYLMIHSGSRNRGEYTYRQYATLEGLKVGTVEFDNYIKEHNQAVEFAQVNRNHLADIFLNMLNIKSIKQTIIDCTHNYLECIDGEYYHHKGSISTLQNDYAIIAGSRGSYSYIVKCIPQVETLFSISHGAGRKWARNLCKGRLEKKYKKDELVKSQLGSIVITNHKTLLYEEATEAYKNIDDIIDVLLEYQCIELIARLKPMVTYKC